MSVQIESPPVGGTYRRPWYRTAAFGLALAWGAWLLVVASSLLLVGRYGIDMPLSDEFAHLPYATSERPITAAWLFSPHNEHRILLPRLAYLAAFAAGRGDFRAAQYANVLVLAAAAAVVLLSRRKVHGRWQPWDALIPLLLVGPGHFENFLGGFQLTFTLTILEAAVVLAAVAWRRGLPGPARLAIVGVTAAAWPWTSGLGAMFAGPLLLWLGYCGWACLGAGLRPRAWAAWAWALAVAGSVGLALWGVGPAHPPGSVWNTLRGAAVCLSISFGPLHPSLGALWPVWTVLVLAILTIAVLVAVRRCVREPYHVVGHCHMPGEHPRALGLLAMIAGVILVALAVGYGRGAMGADLPMPGRYAAPAALGLVAAYLLLRLYAVRGLSYGAVAIMLLLAVVYFPSQVSQARVYGKEWASRRDGIIRRVLLHPEQPAVAVASPMAYGLWLFDNNRIVPDSGGAALELLARHRLGPFREYAVTFPPAPAVESLTEIEVPIRLAFPPHEMEARDDRYLGTTNDPYLAFSLGQVREVVAVRVSFDLDNPAHTMAQLEASWSGPASRPKDTRESYDQSTADLVTPGSHERTFWVCAPIDCLRIDPDKQPCSFRVRKITLFVRPAK